jgi:hypothetical protein
MQMLAGQYPITQVCAVLDCARSSYYHRTTAPDEQGLQQAIAAIAGEWPRCHLSGYLRSLPNKMPRCQAPSADGLCHITWPDIITKTSLAKFAL